MSQLRKEELLLPQWKLVRLGLVNSLAASTIPSSEHPTPVTAKPHALAPSVTATPGLRKASILVIIRCQSIVQSIVSFISRIELLSFAISSRVVYEQIKSTEFQYSIQFSDYFTIFASHALQKSSSQSSSAGLLTFCKISVGGEIKYLHKFPSLCSENNNMEWYF